MFHRPSSTTPVAVPTPHLSFCAFLTNERPKLLESPDFGLLNPKQTGKVDLVYLQGSRRNPTFASERTTPPLRTNPRASPDRTSWSGLSKCHI